ncbi:MAG: hypothetical protein KKF80_02275, partial [Candidatus Omnitrophica bacterium]|nr:hypothetical protein [Candidatus Omnitrophota bacterium]
MHEQTIVDYFTLLKEQGTVGVSYLFVGDNEPLVRDVIKLVSCRESKSFCGVCWDCSAIEKARHPDVCMVDPQPAMIKIDQIRDVQGFLSLKSFRAPRKIVFMRQAQSLGLEAANAFLKTLEEPPRNSFLAIMATKSEGLLPTIVSRCRKIYLPPCGDDTVLIAPEMLVSFLSGEKIRCKDRREFAAFIGTYCAALRDALCAATSGSNIRLLKDQGYEIILRSLGQQFESTHALIA